MPAPQVLPYVDAKDYAGFRVIMADTVPRDRNLWTHWLDEQSRQASARGLGVRYVRIDLAALKAYLEQPGNRPGLPDLLRFAQEQARLDDPR
jgi:hypothetical protein